MNLKCPYHSSYFEFEYDFYGKGLWMDVALLLFHALIGIVILFLFEYHRLHKKYKSGIRIPTRKKSSFKHGEEHERLSLKSILVESKTTTQ